MELDITKKALDDELNYLSAEHQTKTKKIDYNKKSLFEQQLNQREIMSKLKQSEQNYIKQFNQDLMQGFTKDQID